MTKRLLFFATEKDLLPLFTEVERVHALNYIRMAPSYSNAAEAYSSGANLPNLGRASASAAGTSNEFLVVMSGHRVVARRVIGDNGKAIYFFDQLENPASITFSPGGLWEETVLLHGRVATVSEEAASQSLMSLFEKSLRKGFRKIKAYWVGPEAERLLDAGTRLTISAEASRDFDLTRTG
jgi:hypothetical protein